jgi:hypothetical protein
MKKRKPRRKLVALTVKQLKLAIGGKFYGDNRNFALLAAPGQLGRIEVSHPLQ